MSKDRGFTATLVNAPIAVYSPTPNLNLLELQSSRL